MARKKPSAEAFARLFESVHEGVYIGTVDGASSQTLAANPHLKLMFGFGVEAAEPDVRPFELEHFVDPQARDGFLDRLERDGAVHRLPAAAAARRQDPDVGRSHRARRARA